MAGIAQMLRRWVDPVLLNEGFAKVNYGYAQTEDGSRSIFARLQFQLLSKYPSPPDAVTFRSTLSLSPRALREFKLAKLGAPIDSLVNYSGALSAWVLPSLQFAEMSGDSWRNPEWRFWPGEESAAGQAVSRAVVEAVLPFVDSMSNPCILLDLIEHGSANKIAFPGSEFVLRRELSSGIRVRPFFLIAQGASAELDSAIIAAAAEFDRMTEEHRWNPIGYSESRDEMLQWFADRLHEDPSRWRRS